ncbi:MAG: hypothetical protein K1X88_33980 [Nannocystaceae bacterium]|nr:hypothetical protein [Nannocystaceae bacterium]
MLGSATATPRQSSPAVGPTDLKAPPKPLCPPGYRFNYYYQYCDLDTPGPHPRPPLDTPQNAFACRCPSGSSYLFAGPFKGRCWQHGQRGFPASWWATPDGIGLRTYDPPPPFAPGAGLYGDEEPPTQGGGKSVCPDGLTYDADLGICVDDTTKSYCDGIANRVHVRMWSWDCGSRRDDVIDAAIWAARRLYPAWQMLNEMAYAYQHYGEAGKAWARAMWDGTGQLYTTAFPGYAISDFNEYRLLVGLNTLDHALRKITDEPWLVLCHQGHCYDGDIAAHTIPGSIILCPEWFEETASGRGETMLHETLHKANAGWLSRVMRDVRSTTCQGGHDGKCYGVLNANRLRVHPEVRERIYDQQLLHYVRVPASVVNNDNWVRWLTLRYEQFACSVIPPGAPTVEDFS